jgi:hypothetical protein
VFNLVQAALRTSQTASVENDREQAVGMLESLLEAVLDRALSGDLQAAKTALSVVMAEIRLVGLEVAPTRSSKGGSTSCGPATVVISPNDCRHEGCCIRQGRFETPETGTG